MGEQVFNEDLEESPMAEGEQLSALGGVSRTPALFGLAQEGRMKNPLQWPWAHFWVVLPESSWCPLASGLQAGTGAQSPGDTSRSLRRLCQCSNQGKPETRRGEVIPEFYGQSFAVWSCSFTWIPCRQIH